MESEEMPDVNTAQVFITAPTKGRFYRHQNRGGPPYVEVGNRVSPADPVCVIMGMKMLRRIDAEFDCVIEETLVEDGNEVEIGTKLFRVRKL